LEVVEQSSPGFAATVYKVSTLKNGGVSIIFHVAYGHADRALALRVDDEVNVRVANYGD
jgi:hypothetical protein